MEEESGVEEDANNTEAAVSDVSDIDDGSSGDHDLDKSADEVVEDVADTAAGSEGDEFPAATEYETDDNEKTIAYARLKTLMNIREGNSLEADILTTGKKGIILEVLQFCSGG